MPEDVNNAAASSAQQATDTGSSQEQATSGVSQEQATSGEGNDSTATQATAADNAGENEQSEHIPYERFKQVNDDKKLYKEQLIAMQERSKQLESELAQFKTPQEAKVEVDYFADPDKYLEQKTNEKLKPIEKEISELKMGKVQDAIVAKYKSNPYLQKMFKSENELYKKIANNAVEMGFKELTPEAVVASYKEMLVQSMDDVANMAKNMGIEEERTKTQILNGTLPPTGAGSNSSAKKPVASETQKKIWARMGKDPAKMAEKYTNGLGSKFDKSTKGGN